MRRLFTTLRDLAEKRPPTSAPTAQPVGDAITGFEDRVAVLTSHAEQAAAYEEDLISNYNQIEISLQQLSEGMEAAIDAGQDHHALEYIRLAARLRPQLDLLEYEIHAFRAVSNDLILRVNILMEHLDEARAFARTTDLSPAATYHLEQTLTRLMRYFVLLERVATARRRALPERLAEKLNHVLDDRQLDLELARYILQRRRALKGGPQSNNRALPS